MDDYGDDEGEYGGTLPQMISVDQAIEAAAEVTDGALTFLHFYSARARAIAEGARKAPLLPTDQERRLRIWDGWLQRFDPDIKGPRITAPPPF